MEGVNEEVDFEVGAVKIGERRCNNWEVAWKKFKQFLEDGGSKAHGKTSIRRKSKVYC